MEKSIPFLLIKIDQTLTDGFIYITDYVETNQKKKKKQKLRLDLIRRQRNDMTLLGPVSNHALIGLMS